MIGSVRIVCLKINKTKSIFAKFRTVLKVVPTYFLQLFLGIIAIFLIGKYFLFEDTSWEVKIEEEEKIITHKLSH